MIRYAQTPVIFAVYFVCLWRWVDVSLIYHGGGEVRDFPGFYWGWDFAKDFVRYPGGLVEYLSALAAQSLYSSWFGALVLSLQAGLIFGCTKSLLRTMGARRAGIAAFALPLLLLTLYGRYKHYSATISALAFASVAIWLYQRLTALKPWFRVGAALVLAACLYWAAPGGLPVFLLAIMIAGLWAGDFWRTGLVAAMALLAVPYLEGARWSGLSVSEAYEKLLPFRWDPSLITRTDALILVGLYLILPALGAVLGLWSHGVGGWFAEKFREASISARHSSKKGAQAKAAGSKAAVRAASSAGAESNRAKDSNRAGSLLETTFLLATALMTLYLVQDRGLKALLEVDYCAWHRLWPELLAAAPANPRSPYVASATAQALFHTGRLAQELPLLRTPEDLLLAKDADAAHWKKSDLYFDLGYVNMALHHLTEAVEFWGERPVLLQRLAQINFALGNLSTGRMYLKALNKIPFQGGWAGEYLHRLEADPVLEHDEEVGRLRTLMMKRDSVVHLNADEELLAILAANPGNRMAFEYLMTYYLLAKNLTAFVQNLPRAHNFPGFELSPLWEEALVMAARQSAQPLNLKGRALNREAERRLDTMTRVIAASGENEELARSQLRDEYANSYFYYYLFGP